ncbi:MOV10L1 [Bugula neritina]|uniref:RNA helicase n=1 Tax=Bugula neritina TaxID=10212 RepID=A0A7J7J631_BUGNE|nr:MOV10L1 [Bugula neritina]
MVVRAASIWFTVDIVFYKIERIKLICSVISRYVSKIAALCNLDCSSYALFNKRTRLPKSLPYFDVPSQLRNCILTDTKALSRNYPLLEQPLSQQNYTSKFSLLLHIEEVSAEIEIRKFDISAAVFGRSKGYLTLEVLGLPDGQPNLMVGDKLSVSINSHMQPIKYEGYIYEIICDTVYAKFHSSFHDSYGEEECYVIFYISRVPFRRMHMAAKMITQMEWPGIFPHIVSIRSSLLSSDEGRRPPESWLFNRYLNSEQSLSVRRVLEAKCRPFPYVIFGPPGTGKTVTVVECILQVFHRVRGSRILVCTPSNSAADLIAVKLVESYDWPENNLVRLVSFRRQEESLPEEIKAYCKDGQDLALVAEHRVIVSTCSSAGMLYGLGLSTRHFTHVFVDEAGQASEPECLIPISLAAANADTCIVMAGDHKQLGAVVKSQISQTCGLSTSLLERVMQFPPYQRNEEQFQDHTGYDPNLVTKLVQNYRAHPFILSLYSQLFYDNELGEELREGNNPSWFNAVELVQVVKYLQALLKVCQAEKIGVITPYRKQVEKIRQLMGSVGVDPEVKVGSVEEFQGQERQVIIVSTVRSRTEGVDALGKRTAQSLGFLTNSKRFNVTVSRAQALLIVVGNPHILSQDTHWKHLIDYCVENSCYIGVPYQQDNRET